MVFLYVKLQTRNHLLIKLRHYGFSDKMLELIESFLSNGYQKVVIDGRVSFLLLILSGVPQGTVLGPISFLIFINDITTCVLTSTIRCFADDTRACKAVTSCQDVSDLQKDFKNVITWSDCNNMMLHEDKFEYICHQANRSNLLLQLPFTSTYFEYHTLGGNTLPTISLEGISQIICPGHSTLLQYIKHWTPSN